MIKFVTLQLLLITFTIFGAKLTIKHDTASNEIRATWDEFIESWEMKGADRCAAFYTENGLNIPSGLEENKGRTNIASFYRSLFDSNISSTYHHTILDIQVFENHAIEYGEFRVDWVPIEGNDWSFHARSLTHWIKAETGEWKIEKILYNSPPSIY